MQTHESCYLSEKEKCEKKPLIKTALLLAYFYEPLRSQDFRSSLTSIKMAKKNPLHTENQKSSCYLSQLEQP